MNPKSRVLPVLAALFLGTLARGEAQLAPLAVATGVPLVLQSPAWQVQLSPLTGDVTGITDPRDEHHMNWVHDNRPWGIVHGELGGINTVFDHPTRVTLIGPRAADSIYENASLKLAIHREIDDHSVYHETYLFTNVSAQPVSLAAGSVFITVPFNDSYLDGAPRCLTNNCNAHLWAGETSSWANAIRMGGVGPHLGLVLTDGSLASYSILDGASSNDRGDLAFSPPAIDLQPGESYRLGWALFWHDNWKDFWTFLGTQPQFVRLQADHYTVVQGQSIHLTAESASPLDHATLTLNGHPVPTQISGNKLTASVQTDAVGDYLFDLERNGQHTWLKANAVIDPLVLVRARVKFIVENQQVNAPGTPLDGAYIPYDNEKKAAFFNESRGKNHNEGRERIAMGVLVALYIPLCADPALKQELQSSFDRYEAFLQSQLTDDKGFVYDMAGRKGSSTRHGYNYPWVLHAHLAAYRESRDTQYLDLFLKVAEALYDQRKGADYYEIGLPILDGLQAFEQAGMQPGHDELLKDFTRHADAIAARGDSYPRSEVDYEQSIVGPGVQIELEMYLATKNPAYLESARRQMPCLEAFNGQQPDYHLNDIAIRHWDDFWFGKLGLYGDTLPHYWSTITGVAFDEYAEATGDLSYRTRAQAIFLNNMCLFTPDGHASCASVYPAYLMAPKGDHLVAGCRLDPWANDQDWALVNWLTIFNRHHTL